MRKLGVLTAAAALAAVMGFSGTAWAVPIEPTSYDMLNGETGLFPYHDEIYSGAGTPTANLSALSGGLGDLTDDIIAAGNWFPEESPPGNGPYVGWKTIDPIITFNFAGPRLFNTVTIHVDDNDGFDGVSVPASVEITVGANLTQVFPIVEPAGSAPTSFDFDVGGEFGDTVVVKIVRKTQWIMVSEVDFDGGGIGTIKSDSIFTPTPSGIGRAVAFDGLTTLYYTFVGDANIYKATTLGVSLVVPIPLANRAGFTCGALSFDGTDLWCGTYDGTGDVWTVDPTTGVANLEFTQAFNDNGCFSAGGFIDGLAFDASDNSLWLSDDGDTEIFHVTLAGAALGASPFATPTRPGGVGPGCNSGIEVAPGGFLELVLIAFEPGNGDAGDEVSHFIVKVPKDDISGTPIVSFPTQDPNCCEDLAFDALTFAPRAVVWADGVDNEIKAYDVQVTRTIGYWKNHPAEDFDGTSFLPIELGDNDDNGVCDTAVDQADVEEILKAHKGQDTEAKLFAQLLAALLNLAMGDIPPGDLAAILPVIDAAHELLGRTDCNPDTGKKGDDRAEAQELHALLDAFNNKYSP